jgi:carboxyl-terminal processing protease
VEEASARPGKDRLTKALIGLAAVLAVTVIGLAAFIAGRETGSDSTPAASSASDDFDFSILNRIQEILGRDYVKPDNLDSQTLYEAAITGMLNVLNDSGTFYVDPTSFELDTALTGSFDGIGATISQQGEDIVIVAPIKDTPAEKAGIKSGDVILAVDGESTRGWNVEKTVLRIRGPRGTEVTVTIKTDDGQTQDFKLTRARVQVESVSTVAPGGSLRDSSGAQASGLGYIQIQEFTPRTAQELEAAVRKLTGEGARGLIIDVRRNLGGNLASTISSADLFLDSGTILIQRDGDGKETSYVAKQGQVAPGVPIVVLQDRFSASASEVLAAALQENARATVIGEKSFGKGTVNTPRELPDGGALFVTIAQWLTPTGALIDKVGVRPDIEVLLSDEDIDLRRDTQIFRAIEVLRGQVRAP